MIRLCLLLICLLSAAVSAKEKVLYCLDEQGTGYKKQETTYSQTAFTPQRFTVKLDGTSFLNIGGSQYVLGGEYDCSQGKAEKDLDVIKCHHTWETSSNTFTINTASGRYVRTTVTAFGYLTNDTDTDGIFYGTCQDF